jgi:acyl carrier protein
MRIEDRLRQFVVAELTWDGREKLTDDYPLIRRHVIDSMDVLRLVTFIEREFRVKIEDEELVPEHFGTISDMARLVAAKINGGVRSR